MVSYIITYDLCDNSKDYDKLYECIKSNYCWAKLTESSWFIKTNSTSSQIRDRIGKVIDSKDRLFVAKLTGEAAWNNVICSNQYLHQNL